MIEFIEKTQGGHFPFNDAVFINSPIDSRDHDSDLMLAVLYDTEEGNALTEPDGWTLRANRNDVGAGQLWIFEWTGGVVPTIQWEWSIDTAGEALGAILAYRAVAPIDYKQASTSVSPSGTEHDAPSLSVARYSSLLVVAHLAPIAGSWTPPAGMTERVDFSSSAQGTATLALADEEAGASGATGARTATLSATAVALAASVELAVSAPATGEAIEGEIGGVGLG